MRPANNVQQIEEYLDRTSNNRNHGPVFEGRREELAHVDLLYRRAKAGEHQTITLFSGPPGMGKTSLLEEAGLRLMARIGHDYRGLKARPLTVFTSQSEELTSARGLRNLCAEYTHAKHPWTRRLKQLAEGTMRLSPSNIADMKNAIEGLEQSGDLAFDERPFVFLMVDEIQTSDDKNKKFYKKMHVEGVSPRVVPVFAGLSDSAQVLETKCGITRIDSERNFRLRNLEPRDVDPTVEKSLGIAQIPTDSLRFWQDFAFEESDGFPRHLQSVLRAMARAAKESEGSLSEEMEPALRAETQRARTNYYRERITTGKWNSNDVDIAYRIISGNYDENTPEDTAKAAIKAVRGGDPTEDDGRAFLDKMVHIGLVHREDESTFSGGIPSFTTWIHDDYRKRQEAKAAGTTPRMFNVEMPS